MPATLLNTHRVEKPWGRRDLAPLFDDQPAGKAAIGEIWCEDPAHHPRELLVKYLFTSERLSVQVHPDDTAAQARGFPRGKDEAWIILSAEPGATIALGLARSMEAEAVRAAAIDGSLEAMLHWQPVSAGDVIYSPAGTIHAIGKGLRVIEVQQNLDLTYRFYDYGSDRELHLDAALGVSDFGPFLGNPPPRELTTGRSILAEKQRFVLERWTMTGRFAVWSGSAAIWVMPVQGAATLDGQPVRLGDASIIDGGAALEIMADTIIYVAYPGERVLEELVKAETRSDGSRSIA